ncbi:hypothetical protein BURMUCGD1_0104 [Burkholderia multivorans CGD1]|nr:hypothetical protein BURMUCGD1_0104 [Burkholderia multivorans CGD1]
MMPQRRCGDCADKQKPATRNASRVFLSRGVRYFAALTM